MKNPFKKPTVTPVEADFAVAAQSPVEAAQEAVAQVLGNINAILETLNDATGTFARRQDQIQVEIENLQVESAGLEAQRQQAGSVAKQLDILLHGGQTQDGTKETNVTNVVNAVEPTPVDTAPQAESAVVEMAQADTGSPLRKTPTKSTKQS